MKKIKDFVNYFSGTLSCLALFAIISIAFVPGCHRNYSNETPVAKIVTPSIPSRIQVLETKMEKLHTDNEFSVNYIRFTVIRDTHTGEEFLVTRDTNAIVVTKLQASGH